MNKKYIPTMYNKDAKREFLSNYPDATALVYGRVFLKSKDIEEVYGEDLYNFNFEQIENVLYDLRPTSFSAAKSNVSIISMYISWAIEKGLRNNINPLDIVSAKELKQYIASKPGEMYIREDEMFALIDSQLENPQDQVCVILPYFGVQGKGCAEILNLRKQDVDFKNHTLLLTDTDGSQRTLKIEHERADYIFNEIIKDALEVKEYLKKNGQMDTSRPNIREYTDLVENDYVIRTSDIRTENYNSPALPSVVYRRIAFMGEEFGLPTIKYIVRSGMLAMARKLWKRDGELGNKQYEEIMKFYNYKNRNNLREFITIQTIKEVFGDE